MGVKTKVPRHWAVNGFVGLGGYFGLYLRDDGGSAEKF